MRINALEDQETGFNGDVDDNDEGRYILFYFSLAKFAWPLMREILIYILEVFIMFKFINDDNYNKAMNIIVKVMLFVIMLYVGSVAYVMAEYTAPILGRIAAYVIIGIGIKFGLIDAIKEFKKKED